MERQIITVDIAPGNSQVERLGSSQGDIGRPMGVYIIQNGVALDCSAYSAELYILKPDGKFYTTLATVDSTETNLIKWDTAEQETPVAGACAAQIRIASGDDDIGTARFVEFVEASPCDMGSASESEVALLTEYVRQARESATSAGRDATTASGAASSASGSASTASTAASTATQAASAATAAADRAEEVEESIPADYTQLSDDVTGLKSAFEQLDANVITESAGPSPIVSIADGADGMPMRKVEVAIEPVQDLHGYDSPWPAGGGKNLLPFPYVDSTKTASGITFTVNDDGTLTLSGESTGTAFFNFANTSSPFVLKAGTYTKKLTGLEGNVQFNIFNKDGTAIAGNQTDTFTLAEDTECYAQLRVASGQSFNSQKIYPQIESGSVSTDYAPYSNVCPISGWTGAKVTRTGKNLFGGEINQLAFVLKYPGSAIVSGQKYKGIYASVEAGKTYTISRKTIEGNRFRVSASVETPADNIPCIILSNGSENDSKYAVTVTVPSGYNYIFVYLSNQSDTCTSGNYMIELGSTVSAYEAPSIQSVTIPFGQTVYGGTLDVASGKLVVDRVYRTFNGSESWAGEQLSNPLRTYYFITLGALGYVVDENIVCDKYRQVSITSQNEEIGINILNSSARAKAILNLRPNHNGMSVDEFKTWLAENPITCAYKITSTTVYQLTPTEIKTLLGINHVFADCGDTAITYPADTKMYIDRKITEAVANALNA